MTQTTLIDDLNAAIQSHSVAPKGILVNVDMFNALKEAGRLSLMRGFPDFGIEFLALDGSIFVTVYPSQVEPFKLPPQ